jgi:2-C-methyl-D-erythritol 4-phosphate cytidylyltransferase
MSEPTGLRVGLAVPAAGMGRRMGGLRKPWLELAKIPVLQHALHPFLARTDVVAVRVALAPDDASDPPRWLAEIDPRLRIVAGGATRADSVARAVAALPDDLDVILVHDAARPLVSDAVIERVIVAAAGGTGAVAGLPATDTLKRVSGEGLIVATPSREGLWHAQTPQGFPASLMRRGVEALRDDPKLATRVTDDASLVEAVGGEVGMVLGAPRNLKVTRPSDLPLAEWYAAHPDEGEAP